MTHNPERDEVPERIRSIISTKDPDELEVLSEWLDECTEAQYEEYLVLSGAGSSEVELGGEAGDEGDDENERY